MHQTEWRLLDWTVWEGSFDSASYLVGNYDVMKGLDARGSMVYLFKGAAVRDVASRIGVEIDDYKLSRRGWFVIPAGPQHGVVVCKVKFSLVCDRCVGEGIGTKVVFKLGNYYLCFNHFTEDLIKRHREMLRGNTIRRDNEIYVLKGAAVQDVASRF